MDKSAPSSVVSLWRNGLAGLLFLLAFSTNALATTFGFIYTPSTNSFETIQYPATWGGAPFNFPVDTNPTGINDAGVVVGNYSNGFGGFSTGFRFDGTTFTSISYPGAYNTEVNGINNAGQIVGTQLTAPGGVFPGTGQAFLLDGGSFTSFAYPGADYTYGNGINNAGDIVGKYRNEIVVGPGPAVQLFDHGLQIAGTTLTSFEVPGTSGRTEARDINDAGQVVGVTFLSGGGTQGFLKDGNIFTPINVPGAIFTDLRGINNLGHMVGIYQDSSDKYHGFLYDGTTFTVLPKPPPPDGFVDGFVMYTGINNLGQIVGSYAPMPRVPEPSMLLLLACALGVCVVGKWWHVRAHL